MTIQGAKTRYVKDICPILQKTIDENNVHTFIDACVGGANIIMHIKCENRIGIDNNKYLIALLKEIQKPTWHFPDEFITREVQERCRDGKEPRDQYTGLCAFAASYSGKGFNGSYITRNLETSLRQYKNRIAREKPLLEGINFICDDYSSICSYKNAVIYLDPPYKNKSKYDTSKVFDYKKFQCTVREVAQSNYVYISENDAPEDFHIIQEKDGVFSWFGKVHPTVEKLFVCNTGLLAQ